MQTELLDRLPHNLYPANSQHGQEIRKHFKKRFLRELTDDERAELAQVTFCPLVFSNRSGSNLLSELLVQAGLGFYPTGEPLNIQSVRNISTRQDLDNFTDYLLFLVRRCQRDGVAGFKMTIDQLFDLTRLGVLEPFGDIKLVHSVRRDLLAQAISHFKARETGKWVSQTKSDTPVEVPYEGADIIRCLHAVTQRRGHYDYYRTLHRVPGINVFYEDVLDDPAAAVTRVGDFLERPVDTGAVNIDAVKIKQQRDRVNRELRAQFVADFSVGSR